MPRSTGVVGVLFFTAFFLVTPWARAQGDGLSLEDSIRYALSSNERALKAPLRVNVAEGQLDRARASFLPNLTATGNGTLRTLAGTTGDRSPLTVTGSATLSQSIVNMPSFPLYAQASHQLDSERYGAKQDRRVLAFDVARAYLQTLTAERLLEAATRRLERAKANLDNATGRAEAQLASVNDATRANIEMTTSQREVAQAQGTVTRAYVNLEYLVRRTVTGPLSAPDVMNRDAEQFSTRLDELVRTALERRPDLKAATERTLALQASAREPLYRLFPSLGVQGQIRTTVDPTPPDRGHDESALLTLTWVAFDGGARYGDHRSRTAQAESQALDESLLRRGVETEIRLALASLKAARESLKISEDAVVFAQKNTEETEILYRQGLARAIEVTDATARRFDAEVARATARLQMQQAWLELRFSLGLAPLGVDIDAPQAARSGEAR
ncbi:MAG: TolC family protein [Polyangiaceae bacterium]|nr:TolC family protein [Polyangiaceae bacterium]